MSMFFYFLGNSVPPPQQKKKMCPCNTSIREKGITIGFYKQDILMQNQNPVMIYISGIHNKVMITKFSATHEFI